jgi:hypothetical protein
VGENIEVRGETDLKSSSHGGITEQKEGTVRHENPTPFEGVFRHPVKVVLVFRKGRVAVDILLLGRVVRRVREDKRD